MMCGIFPKNLLLPLSIQFNPAQTLICPHIISENHLVFCVCELLRFVLNDCEKPIDCVFFSPSPDAITSLTAATFCFLRNSDPKSGSPSAKLNGIPLLCFTDAVKFELIFFLCRKNEFFFFANPIPVAFPPLWPRKPSVFFGNFVSGETMLFGWMKFDLDMWPRIGDFLLRWMFRMEWRPEKLLPSWCDWFRKCWGFLRRRVGFCLRPFSSRF